MIRPRPSARTSQEEDSAPQAAAKAASAHCPVLGEAPELVSAPASGVGQAPETAPLACSSGFPERLGKTGLPPQNLLDAGSARPSPAETPLFGGASLGAQPAAPAGSFGTALGASDSLRHQASSTALFSGTAEAAETRGPGGGLPSVQPPQPTARTFSGAETVQPSGGGSAVLRHPATAAAVLSGPAASGRVGIGSAVDPRTDLSRILESLRQQRDFPLRDMASRAEARSTSLSSLACPMAERLAVNPASLQGGGAAAGYAYAPSAAPQTFSMPAVPTAPAPVRATAGLPLGPDPWKFDALNRGSDAAPSAAVSGATASSTPFG